MYVTGITATAVTVGSDTVVTITGGSGSLYWL
jgi:hypothetical protein